MPGWGVSMVNIYLGCPADRLKGSLCFVVYGRRHFFAGRVVSSKTYAKVIILSKSSKIGSFLKSFAGIFSFGLKAEGFVRVFVSTLWLSHARAYIYFRCTCLKRGPSPPTCSFRPAVRVWPNACSPGSVAVLRSRRWHVGLNFTVVKVEIPPWCCRNFTTVAFPLHHGGVLTAPRWSFYGTMVEFLRHHGGVAPAPWCFP